MRHVDVEHVKPVIKIAAQFTRSNGIIRNLVGGGHTRTSTDVSTLLPKRRSLWSSSTRSNLACVPTGISPISFEQDRAPFGQLKASVRRSSAP